MSFGRGGYRGNLRFQQGFWSGTRDSNPRHPAWEAGTLPTELVPQSDPFVSPRFVGVNDVTKKRPGPPKGTGPSRSRSFDRSCAAPWGGSYFLLPQASALWSGGRDVLPSGRVTSGKTTTTVRCFQRTSLRLLSRVRATTILHCAFPPPACRRPRAQRSRPPPRASVSSWGSKCGARRPGFCRACGGTPPPDHPGRYARARRAYSSLTPKIGSDRGAPEKERVSSSGRRREHTGEVVVHLTRKRGKVAA